MRIHLEATEKLTKIDGQMCRVWEGQTERGVPCKVFVARVAVEASQDLSQFEQELMETLPPGRVFPLSQVL